MIPQSNPDRYQPRRRRSVLHHRAHGQREPVTTFPLRPAKKHPPRDYDRSHGPAGGEELAPTVASLVVLGQSLGERSIVHSTLSRRTLQSLWAFFAGRSAPSRLHLFLCFTHGLPVAQTWLGEDVSGPPLQRLSAFGGASSQWYASAPRRRCGRQGVPSPGSGSSFHSQYRGASHQSQEGPSAAIQLP